MYISIVKLSGYCVVWHFDLFLTRNRAMENSGAALFSSYDGVTLAAVWWNKRQRAHLHFSTWWSQRPRHLSQWHSRREETDAPRLSCLNPARRVFHQRCPVLHKARRMSCLFQNVARNNSLADSWLFIFQPRTYASRFHLSESVQRPFLSKTLCIWEERWGGRQVRPSFRHHKGRRGTHLWSLLGLRCFH
jgi:hypothetical protein